jgi:hypothetical protein
VEAGESLFKASLGNRERERERESLKSIFKSCPILYMKDQGLKHQTWTRFLYPDTSYSVKYSKLSALY